MKPDDLVAVSTLDDAEVLLDQWIAAYERDVRAYARALEQSRDDTFRAEAAAVFWEHQAALYRSQLALAGLQPLDAYDQPAPQVSPLSSSLAGESLPAALASEPAVPVLDDDDYDPFA